MNSDPEPVTRHSRPIRLRPSPGVAAPLLATVLLLAVVPAAALSGPGETRSAAQRLARQLPAEARRLAELREPAATVQTQLGVALGELREMDALTYDPHYLPALIAVGRAHLAASGRDPLTGTTVDPNYLGLERELAESTGGIEAAASEAGRLSRGVQRLQRDLARSQRRQRRLERELRHLRGAESRRRRG